MTRGEELADELTAAKQRYEDLKRERIVGSEWRGTCARLRAARAAVVDAIDNPSGSGAPDLKTARNLRDIADRLELADVDDKLRLLAANILRQYADEATGGTS